MPFDGTASDTAIPSSGATVEPRNNRGWPRTKRQLDWAFLHVVEGLSAHSAALKAGYSEETAKAKSHALPRMLAPFIAYLQERKNNTVERDLEVTVDRVLREVAAIAFANFHDFLRPVRVNGLQYWIGKPPDELTPPQRIAVRCYTAVEITTDFGVEMDYRYELRDKLQALFFVGRHLGMLSETLIIERARQPVRAHDDYSGVPNELLVEAAATLAVVKRRLEDRCVAPGSPDGDSFRVAEAKRLVSERLAREREQVRTASRYSARSDCPEARVWQW